MEVLPDVGLLGMLAQATLAVKMVLLFLVGMSIWSWTIIFYKIFLIGSAKTKVESGLDEFQAADDLAAGLKILGKETPLARVSSKAVREFRKLESADIQRERKQLLVADTLRRNLRQGVSAEMKRLSSHISFLATCANGAPFIGLFGTVWGIMDAFHAIGQAQSAALTTVAPAISEALIATAIGLAVAIPATIAYNFFLARLNEVETQLVNFAGSFLNRVEREVAWVQGGNG